MPRAKIAVTAIVTSLSLLAPPAAQGVATMYRSAVDVPPGSPLVRCISAAAESNAEAWTCLGGDLTTPDRDPVTGEVTWTSRTVVADSIVSSTGAVRKSDAGPDSYCGYKGFDTEAIGPGHPRAWFPNENGLSYNDNRLTGRSNKYHDDYYGSFTARGVPYSTGVLHTGRWKYCSSCRYYQVPWTPDP